MGLEFDVQKNRMNRQIICVGRLPPLPEYKDFNPVENGLQLIARRNALGFTDPETPLCVYKKDDNIFYLTGNEITKYFRFVAKLVNPLRTQNCHPYLLIPSGYTHVSCYMRQERTARTSNCAYGGSATVSKSICATPIASHKCRRRRSLASTPTW